MFAAIHAAGGDGGGGRDNHANVDVTVLEAGRHTLTKVKISGGGRCNVLHDVQKPIPAILEGYPRGQRELRGIFTKHFPVTEAAAWFEKHGVELKTESDGRMFPVTDSSQTVMDALLQAADDARVRIQTGAKVEAIVPPTSNGKDASSSFRMRYTEKKDGSKRERQASFDAVILATGSAPAGYALVRELLPNDTDFVDPMPSLFTLTTKLATKDETGVLHGLSGVSVPKARVSYRLNELVDVADAVKPSTSKRRKKAKWIEQEGPLLITHSGLSGPAALRLSAYGARDIGKRNYRGDLKVHWAPDFGTVDDLFEEFWSITTRYPKRSVASVCPLLLLDHTNAAANETEEQGVDTVAAATTAIPKRLWSRLVTIAAGIDKDLNWGAASKDAVRKLATAVGACPLEMTSKGTFKEEFVTAGGVSLKAIDMKNMQCRSCPGLFLCGELINVDGVTGACVRANE